MYFLRGILNSNKLDNSKFETLNYKFEKLVDVVELYKNLKNIGEILSNYYKNNICPHDFYTSIQINDEKGNLYLPIKNSYDDSFKIFEISKNNARKLEHYSENNSESYGSYRNLENYECVSINDFYYNKYFTSSDYYGSFVELSNRQFFIENFENTEGIIPTYGGHGTKSLVIKISSINEDIVDSLNSLENYPVLDENLMSEMEEDEKTNSWSYFDYDFKRKIEEAFDFSFDEFDHIIDFAKDLYWECIYLTEEEFQMENLTAYIDIEHMITKIDENEFYELVEKLRNGITIFDKIDKND